MNLNRHCIGPVHEAPRGKVGRDGRREFTFRHWHGHFIDNPRFWDEGAAERARQKIIAANPTIVVDGEKVAA